MLRRLLAQTGVVALIATLTLSNVAYAAGYSWISGSATSTYTWYATPRYVTNSATVGPEVAFFKNSGPSGLELGAYRCGQ